MTVQPSGARAVVDDGDRTLDAIVFARTLDAPLAAVWHAVTDSAVLGRWFGTWTGDPADGHIAVTMNAEGYEDPPALRYDIRTCEPGREVRVVADNEFGRFDLAVRLAPAGEGTALTLTDVVTNAEQIEYTGPGWDYYLDRLTAVLAGVDPDTIIWDEHLAALQPHYRAVQETFGH